MLASEPKPVSSRTTKLLLAAGAIALAAIVATMVCQVVEYNVQQKIKDRSDVQRLLEYSGFRLSPEITRVEACYWGDGGCGTYHLAVSVFSNKPLTRSSLKGDWREASGRFQTMQGGTELKYERQFDLEPKAQDERRWLGDISWTTNDGFGPSNLCRKTWERDDLK